MGRRNGACLGGNPEIHSEIHLTTGYQPKVGLNRVMSFPPNDDPRARVAPAHDPAFLLRTQEAPVPRGGEPLTPATPLYYAVNAAASSSGVPSYQALDPVTGDRGIAFDQMTNYLIGLNQRNARQQARPLDASNIVPVSISSSSSGPSMISVRSSSHGSDNAAFQSLQFSSVAGPNSSQYYNIASDVDAQSVRSMHSRARDPQMELARQREFEQRLLRRIEARETELSGLSFGSPQSEVLPPQGSAMGFNGSRTCCLQ